MKLHHGRLILHQYGTLLNLLIQLYLHFHLGAHHWIHMEPQPLKNGKDGKLELQHGLHHHGRLILHHQYGIAMKILIILLLHHNLPGH